MNQMNQKKEYVQITFKLIITSVVLLTTYLTFAFAKEEETTKKEIQFFTSYVEITSSTSPFIRLSFVPDQLHHFNLSAPNQAKLLIQGKEQALTLKGDKFTLFAEMPKYTNCELNLKLFLCDEANSYCLPKEKTLSCNDLFQPRNLMTEAQSQRWSDIAKSEVQTKGVFPKESDSKKNSSLFILNNPKLALEKAKIENKPLLIDFFATWCPPCNVLGETVFNNPKFKLLSQKMIYLKLDVDLPVSWELKSKFAIKGYPTIILASPEGEEIQRIIGVLEPENFLKKMIFSIKNKNSSIKKLEELFKTAKTKQQEIQIAWDLIAAYNNQEIYTEALKLIPIASQKKVLSLKEKDLLQYIPLKVSLENSDLKAKLKVIDFIKASIENFPSEETFLDKLNLLEGLAEESKDDSLKKWVQLQTLKITNDLITRKIPDSQFLTTQDILFIRADAFEKLGFKTEAQYVYQEVVKELEKQIKKYKLNLQTNRGFNLDRVYAIYKSGDIERADKLYTTLSQEYPEEFTFYYNHASVLKELGRKEAALEKAKLSLKYSYGDNKLRATYLTADLYKSLDQNIQAKKIIEETLSTYVPPEDKNIRTSRYYKKLVDLKAQLN